MRVIVWRHTRLNGNCWRLAKVITLLLVLLWLVIPIRNTLLFFAIPGMWMEHNSLFLLKVLWDTQYFPVEETPIDPSPIKLNINFDDIETKFTPKQPTFLEYYERTKLLQQMSKFDFQAQAELDELLKFQPKMTEHERAIALFTIDVFSRACEAANLTYFLVSGSILGAARHHGMIPWDDDIDIIMNGSQWKEIRSVLANVQGFELFSPPKSQWKFFMKSLPNRGKPFKWPFIDIFFYNEDATRVWAQTWGARASLCSKKSDVFPLRRRKFEMWSLPVPRLASSLVIAEFGNFSAACKTANYNHKANAGVSGSDLVDVDCQKLHKVFPFVFHEPSKHGTVMEVCKVAGQKKWNITLPLGA